MNTSVGHDAAEVKIHVNMHVNMMTLYKYWRKSIKTTCILQHLYNNNTLSTALYQCHPWLTSVPLCQFRDINSAKPTAVSRQQSSHGDGGSFGSPTWQEVMHWLDWVITGCLFAPSRSTFFFFLNTSWLLVEAVKKSDVVISARTCSIKSQECAWVHVSIWDTGSHKRTIIW